MKNLRKLIRQTLLENKYSFLEDLKNTPGWDEGTRKPFGSEDYDAARKRGKIVKKAFQKWANREMLDSLMYIHWTESLESLKSLIVNSDPKSNKDEISCEIFDGFDVPSMGWGSFGVVIEGYVTLAGNSMDDMWTGKTSKYREKYPHRDKSSGQNKGVMTAAMDTYILDYGDFDDSIRQGHDNSEALLDNWRITGVIATRWNIDEIKQLLDEIEKETGRKIRIIKDSTSFRYA